MIKRLVVEQKISVLFHRVFYGCGVAYADCILVLARGVLIADGNAEAVRDGE